VANMPIYGVVGIALSTVIAVALFITYCCKVWSDNKSSNYVSASSSNHIDGSDPKNAGRTGNKGFGGRSPYHYKKGEDSSEYDLSEEASRMEQRMMLQT